MFYIDMHVEEIETSRLSSHLISTSIFCCTGFTSLVAKRGSHLGKVQAVQTSTSKAKVPYQGKLQRSVWIVLEERQEILKSPIKHSPPRTSNPSKMSLKSTIKDTRTDDELTHIGMYFLSFYVRLLVCLSI